MIKKHLSSKEIFGDCGQTAIQIHDSSSPFGSTSVYSYPNVAFEVSKQFIYFCFLKVNQY